MATMNGRSHTSPTAEVGGRVRNILADVVEVTELQALLLRHDVSKAKANAIRGGIVLSMAIVTALGAIPLLLTALAFALESVSSLSHTTSLLIVGGSACLIAVLALIVAGKLLSKSVESFQRSQAELAANVAWVKSMIRSDTVSPSPQENPWRKI